MIRYELAKHGLTDHLAFVWCCRTTPSENRTCSCSIPPPHDWASGQLDIWFIGDRLDTDVAGAKAAGMTAVWFNPNGRPDVTASRSHSDTWNDFARHVLGEG